MSLRRRAGGRLEGGTHVSDLDHAHVLRPGAAALRPAAGRHEGQPETEPGGLGQPPGHRTDPADLAGEPHLADGHQMRVECQVEPAGGDRERHRRRVIERILTQYEDLAPEDLEFLLAKLGDIMQPENAAA